MATSLLAAHGWLYATWSTMDIPQDCPTCSAFDGAKWWTVEEFAPFADHLEEGYPGCTADHCGCSFVTVSANESQSIDIDIPAGLPQDIYDFVRGRS